MFMSINAFTTILNLILKFHYLYLLSIPAGSCRESVSQAQSVLAMSALAALRSSSDTTRLDGCRLQPYVAISSEPLDAL